jgi:hypothetical protein
MIIVGRNPCGFDNARSAKTGLAGVTLSAWATGLQVTVDQSIFAAYLENVKGKLRSTDIYDVP